MNLQRLTTSRFGTGFGMLLGRLLPRRAGYAVGRALADAIAARKDAALTRAIRLNQWVLGGMKASKEDLDSSVRQVLRHQARCIVDLHQCLKRPETLREQVAFGPNARALVDSRLDAERGVVLAGSHLSNFDLAMVAFGWGGAPIMVLAYAEPTGGYRMQNALREQSGLEVVPINIGALKAASRRLKGGGLVATGVDRPIPEARAQATFCGHPAILPTGHVRLALDTGADLRAFICYMQEDGRYFLDFSEPLPLEPHPDRQTRIRRGAEAVLQVLEPCIRQHRHQWLMYYPVWPQYLAQMP